MKEPEILSRVTAGHLFNFVARGQRTYSFSKIG
jgi:hypothetical protein